MKWKHQQVEKQHTFRLINEQDYIKTSRVNLKKALTNFTENFNRGMIDINFRREPIFLTEEMLTNQNIQTIVMHRKNAAA